MAGPGKYGGFDPPPDEAVPEPAPGVADLAERNLAEFPAVTKALRAAVEINLEGNELVSVPTGVLSRLTRLETLRLTGCALTHLPEDLGRCESIARLFAGANRITDASPAFELPCGVHVGLSHNRIGQLPPPEVTARAEALMSLDLTHNDLCVAGDALASLAAMPSLRALSLAGNPMAMAPGFSRAVADAIPELLMLDGVRLERPPPGHAEDDSRAPPSTAASATVTIKFKVTNASCELDPPMDHLGNEPDGDDEKGSQTEDVNREKGEGGGGVPEDGEKVEGDGGEGGEGVPEEGVPEEGEAEPEPEAEADESEFFVRFSVAPAAGDDDDDAGTFAIPRRRRTPPEPEGGEGGGEGAEGAEGAEGGEGDAGEGDAGEATDEVAAAAAAVVEEDPDDPDTTFYADLPLTVATRDLLHRGVTFEMCKVEMVPRVDDSPKEPREDADAGGDAEGAEGQPEGQSEGPSEGQSELVERVTVVGVAVVRLGSLLSGVSREWSGEVDFTRVAPMYRKTPVGEVLVALGGDGSGAGERAGRATVTCVMHATRPVVEGDGGGEEGEETAAEE